MEQGGGGVRVLYGLAPFPWTPGDSGDWSPVGLALQACSKNGGFSLLHATLEQSHGSRFGSDPSRGRWSLRRRTIANMRRCGPRGSGVSNHV